MTMKVRLALLTGGSSGIGLAVATELVRNGVSAILIIARRKELLTKAKEELMQVAMRNGLPVQIHILSLDVSDANEVSRKIPPLLDEIGTPDFCYIGAGIAHPDHFEKISHEIFQRTMDVNVGGAWNVLSAVIPLMKTEGGGTIAIVSSLAGLVGTYGYSAYAASKFALVGLSQCLRNELKPDGIDVKVLCPPDTDTPQLAAENKTKPDETQRISKNAAIMSPQAVAKTLIEALGNKRFLIIPGAMGKFGWFIYRFFPRLVYRMFDREVNYVRKQKATS